MPRISLREVVGMDPFLTSYEKKKGGEKTAGEDGYIGRLYLENFFFDNGQNYI